MYIHMSDDSFVSSERSLSIYLSIVYLSLYVCMYVRTYVSILYIINIHTHIINTLYIYIYYMYTGGVILDADPAHLPGRLQRHGPPHRRLRARRRRHSGHARPDQHGRDEPVYIYIYIYYMSSASFGH